ncbi:PA0069 family radical SAM protein [Mangrovimicrobium sediminis]|uniref:PA0069 family radical SAM protein n=1 Tax=Mangrovimicrobium sediminis TaxID=2562682 RepID=A0A4Z0M6M0_9GAMM|nr:PA0069 family radical SAM protein [Haliea sp. SAOS-164]TGD75159.1 PA0069 family radical SAM protein [Haliea sp. SAOS-164]
MKRSEIPIVNQQVAHPGRGARSNRESRYQPTRVDWDDGICGPSPVTECRAVTARSIITRNQSPDVPFSQSINPYQGCEHGCIYCYARPSHAYLDLSPGLDFETRLTRKTNAAELLRRELARPGYVCRGITLGANTDPYQPLEKEHRITRQLLEVLLECRHPVAVITKGALVTRDKDLLGALADHGLCSVMISVTTLDADLKRRLEPRAASGAARLAAMRELREAGVPVGLLYAPVIPALNDHEMESILAAAAQAGATSAAYILLRLPLEIAELFQDWLEAHYPQRAGHVMSILRQSRGGRDNDSRFGHRMRGEGPFADLLSQRFRVACRRLGIDLGERGEARTDLFRPPRSAQGDLFSEA